MFTGIDEFAPKLVKKKSVVPLTVWSIGDVLNVLVKGIDVRKEVCLSNGETINKNKMQITLVKKTHKTKITFQVYDTSESQIISVYF